MNAYTDRESDTFAADTAVSPNGHVKPVEFEVITAKALCELPDPDASDELLGGLVVRRQRTVIGADTGAGKTGSSRHLVVNLAENRARART